MKGLWCEEGSSCCPGHWARDGGKFQEPRNVGNLQKLGKAGKWNLPDSLRAGMQPCWRADFSPAGHEPDF